MIASIQGEGRKGEDGRKEKGKGEEGEKKGRRGGKDCVMAVGVWTPLGDTIMTELVHRMTSTLVNIAHQSTSLHVVDVSHVVSGLMRPIMSSSNRFDRNR